MSLVGVLLGSGLALARLTPRLRADLAWARRARVPWPSTTVLSGLIALCLAAAVITIVDAGTNSRRVAGVALVGMAVVLLAPLVLGLRSTAGLSQRPSALLRSRLITAAGGSWMVMLLFGLQAVLTTGAVTMATSAVETFNSSLVSAVPEDQARVDVLNVGDPDVATGVVEDVRAALGATEAFTYRMLEAPTSAADGPVVVVDTPRQAADVLGLPGLSTDEAEALNGGGVLRSATASGGNLAVLDPTPGPTGQRRVVADLPVTSLPRVKGSLATGGGVLLAPAAQGLEVPISPEIAHVFPRLTPEQRVTASQLPERLRFNPEWMDLPKAPDTVSVPDSAVWGSADLAGLGFILALIYGLQAGAAGRRVLAGAQAMGLRMSWVRAVLAGQIAWVVVAPAVAGVVGSALGVVAVAAIKGIPLDLHVPWELVGVMALGTTLAFVGATFLALRGLDARERIG